MQNPAFASTLMIVGIVIVLLSAFGDPLLGLGRLPRFAYWRTLGALVGALVILVGVHLRRR